VTARDPDADKAHPEAAHVEAAQQTPAREPAVEGARISSGSRMPGVFAAFQQLGPRKTLLEDKITSAHITEILGIEREAMRHSNADRSDQRRHHTTLAIIASLFADRPSTRRPPREDFAQFSATRIRMYVVRTLP
jgi:hypothetical protein